MLCPGCVPTHPGHSIYIEDSEKRSLCHVYTQAQRIGYGFSVPVLS